MNTALELAEAVAANGPLAVRAMAKVSKTLAAEAADLRYSELLSSGILALMLEPADSEQPSRQAMVPIDGASLARVSTLFSSSHSRLGATLQNMASTAQAPIVLAQSCYRV